MSKADIRAELDQAHYDVAKHFGWLQCQMRYSYDVLREMLEDIQAGEDIDPQEVIDCIDMYNEFIGAEVVKHGELNEKAGRLALSLDPLLKIPDFEKILCWLRRLFNGRAGWK